MRIVTGMKHNDFDCVFESASDGNYSRFCGSNKGTALPRTDALLQNGGTFEGIRSRVYGSGKGTSLRATNVHSEDNIFQADYLGKKVANCSFLIFRVPCHCRNRTHSTYHEPPKRAADDRKVLTY